MAEYAAAYGAPAPSMPWPLFLAMVQRTQRFDARARLRLLDSVAAAIGVAFGADQGGRVREELLAAAYPLRQQGVRWVENVAAREPDDA